ncbi:MAG: PilN domain-containing protein [Verrucomicrobiae bacterium]|nr:PilN domain-containing protein [Verrucomicrobiae bacterium]
MKTSSSPKALVLSARPSGEHWHLHTVLDGKSRPIEPIPVAADRKTAGRGLGGETGRFQNTLLTVDSGRVLLQVWSLPTTDRSEIASMVSAKLAAFPVLLDPEFDSAHAIVGRNASFTNVLVATYRRSELAPLLEHLENWGQTLPRVLPDAWVHWLYLREKAQSLPASSWWVWVETRNGERPVAKILLSLDGELRFVHQPFLADHGPEDTGRSLAQALAFAEAAARREDLPLPANLPVYFSADAETQLFLDSILSVAPGSPNWKAQLPLSVASETAAAELFQADPVRLGDWLPRTWQERQADRLRRFKRNRALRTAAWSYALFLVLLLGWIGWQSESFQSLKHQKAMEQAAFDKATSLQNQIDRMKAQAEGSQNALDVLYEASRAMPKDVTLIGYGYKDQESVVLRGFATTPDSVYTYKDVLGKLPVFHSIELGPIHNNNQKNWVEFEIKCTLRGAPAAGAPAQELAEASP